VNESNATWRLAGGGAALALAALLAALLAIRPALGAPTELFISEYVEGSSSNKALEVFNGTGAPVTLTGSYDVQIFANGSPTATATIPLTGTIADGDVFVLARTAAVAAILAVADQTTTNFLWNGNDAVVLRRDGAIVDAVGQVGVDPGVEWGTGDTSTADHTLRRKPAIQAGDPDSTDSFDPAGEWDGFAIDSFDGLGSHSIDPGGGGGGGSGGDPTAVLDSVTLDEDAGATSVAVLANDHDPDGDTLTIVAASDGAHGMVTITGPGGSVSYTPEVDFNGSDSFTYTASDGQGGEDTATVAVTVLPVNDDPDPDDDQATTAEDTEVSIPVLANDTDVDGDALTVADVEEPAHGEVEILAGGAGILYRPQADFNGTEILEYTVEDGNGGEDAGEVTVTVTPVNDPPRARSDIATVRQGQPLAIDVTANDAPGPPDESSQQLTVVSTTEPAHGQAEIVASGPDQGKVLYTPQNGYTGPDSFGYVVSDGSATATATVSVVVGPAPLRTLCALPPTIAGTFGNDVLTGTPGDDVIRARRGNDVINGGGGSDIVCAGPGADRITTGAGDDRIAAGTGPDTVDSGGGHDRLRGGVGVDDLSSGPGNDSVAAGAGNDLVDGGDGDNTLHGGPGDDALQAGSGADRVDGGPGTDSCDADGGRNTVLRCE
jgi:hypothetical protein